MFPTQNVRGQAKGNPKILIKIKKEEFSDLYFILL